MPTDINPAPPLTPASPSGTAQPAAFDASAPLGADDFYMDGEFLVFTAYYHQRRGYCCNSDCRHCPYRGPVEDAQ